MQSPHALPSRRSSLRRARSDEGVSLIETIVALSIAGAVLAAMSISLLQTARASVTARQNQQAADVMNEQLEYVRSLNYAAATHVKTDLAGDTNLTYNSGSDTYFLATSVGNEPVVAGTVGSIANHVQTAVRQNTTYTTSTYVTSVTDTVNATSAYRRVTVLTSWNVNGVAHSRRTSSFITDTRRGLPLPRFSMGASGTYKTNVGATLALPVTITNVGAPDAFNLTASAPPSGTWTWYVDTDLNGVFTSGTDSAMTDSDSNGASDTGLLQVGQSLTFFAVRVIATGEATTQTVSLSATSAAQPAATTATNAFTDTVLVNPASCTCTLTTFYLHNSTTNGATTYQGSGSSAPMLMDTTAPAAARTSLFNYSTDCSVTTYLDCLLYPYGRHLAIGGATNESSKPKVAAWYFSVPNDTYLKGTASITLWARAADGSGAGGQLIAYLGSDQNNGINGSFNQGGTSGTITVPAASPADWQAFTVGIPIISSLSTYNTVSPCATGTGCFKIDKPKNLVIRVVATGSLNVRLAYDTTLYNASALIPVVAPLVFP